MKLVIILNQKGVSLKLKETSSNSIAIEGNLVVYVQYEYIVLYVHNMSSHFFFEKQASELKNGKTQGLILPLNNCSMFNVHTASAY